MTRVTRVASAVVVVASLAGACSSSSKSSSSPSNTPSSSSPTGATTSAQTTPAPRPMPPGPTCVRFDNGKGCMPVAPQSRRVDLVRPVFSNPLQIDNPLHPSGKIDQVIYGGQVGGKPFRTEFTRLPAAKKTVVWEGTTIPAVSWQYMAFSAGRIEEVAIDWFAQADDGGVWYLGEDVQDYRDGRIYTKEGTWVTGPVAPPALIMPPAHGVGDAYRTENAPGIVFEEVTVKAVGQTVSGPSGPIKGTIKVSELHTDGGREDKIFAPGYGEFSTGSPDGDLEAAALAFPTDARPGGVPARLTVLSRWVQTVYDAVSSSRWSDARTALGALTRAWRPGTSLLDKQLGRDRAQLGVAVANRSSARARSAALRVAQDVLDQRLRYVPLATIEKARFDLWRRQIGVDARANDGGSVAGDVAALWWTWDRVRPTIGPAVANRVDAQLKAAAGADPRTAARIAAALSLT